MMLENFDLTIITPTSIQTEKILWVEIESPTGSFIVGYNHSPLISLIKKQGSLTYHLAGSQESAQETSQEISMIVSGGIFSVSKNKAIVLLDQ